MIFKLFSKGGQLKIKLANLQFSEIGDGRLFLVFGGSLVLGGRDCGNNRGGKSKKTLFGVVILAGMTTGRVVISCPIKRKQYIIEG